MQARQAPGMPGPDRNHVDATGAVTGPSLASEIRDFHWRGLRSRRHRDLTAEKYLLHVDGEGGAQWYDLFHGTRLRIPANLSGTPRVQNNQLRPILDNFVAHLTTQPFRFVVETKQSRESRESAVLDQALINDLVRRQNWNALWAEAKYMAACYGFCPVHAMWRDDMLSDPYEAVAATGPGGEPMMGPRPGMIDNWVGNPFDTVFSTGSRRYSIHRQTYGRVLPAEMVRAAFGREDIEGNDRLPSATTFQRIAQKWTQTSGMVHGSSILTMGWGHEEMVGLIYDELLPGVDSAFPNGRLAIIGLDGLAATSRDEARGGLGEPKLLWVGELPARTFSSVNVYSHHRSDDPLGKPFIADLDDDQIQLNQLESLVNEYLRRASRPPLASSGKVNVETVDYRNDTILEVEPLTQGRVELQYLEYPARHIPLLSEKIERVLDGMYRKGGWQAASRGETTGESGKAIIALQTADDSIFGPIAQRTTEELQAFAQLNWRLAKEFMDVPQVIQVTGDELAHMARPYVDRTKLSPTPPLFTLVSAFGTSTEAKAQQLLNLFGMVDAAGEQVLGTRELRKLWPDNSLFQVVDDPAELRIRRPRVINQTIRTLSGELRQQYPQLSQDMGDPMLNQAAMMLLMEVDRAHPALMDDDLAEHIDALSILTQDETEDPLARKVAIFRQQQFFQWLAMKQLGGSMMGTPAEAAMSGSPVSNESRPDAERAFNPADPAGTSQSASMQQAEQAREVS